MTSLRPARDDDWPAILRVAKEALPNAPDGNIGWLEARRRFDGLRRHYVAEEATRIVAYGGIEASGEGRWRLFIVMDAMRLASLGVSLLHQLMNNVRDLEGHIMWMREQADDAALLSFAREHGFHEKNRFVVQDGSAYDGVEVVELEQVADD